MCPFLKCLFFCTQNHAMNMPVYIYLGLFLFVVCTVQKIPSMVVQGLNLEPSGSVVLSADNTPDVIGQFYPSTDGRMIVSVHAWGDFAEKKGLAAGQVVMFLFHQYGDIITRRQGVVITVDVI
jgi:hypothetical protein